MRSQNCHMPLDKTIFGESNTTNKTSKLSSSQQSRVKMHKNVSNFSSIIKLSFVVVSCHSKKKSKMPHIIYTSSLITNRSLVVDHPFH